MIRIGKASVIDFSDIQGEAVVLVMKQLYDFPGARYKYVHVSILGISVQFIDNDAYQSLYPKIHPDGNLIEVKAEVTRQPQNLIPHIVRLLRLMSG